MTLVVSKQLNPVIGSLKRQLPQSILLYGESGTGLTTIAAYIAGSDYDLVKPTTHGNSVKSTIAVDDIRQLYVQTRSKQNRLVVVIDDAHSMTLPAQHAFLKLLEEPNQNVHFILVTSAPGKLLPTVSSRLQSYHVPLLEAPEFVKFLDSFVTDPTTRKQIAFVASGRPALARRLHDNPNQLEKLAAIMREAQVFVGPDRYLACQAALRHAGSAEGAQELVKAGIKILRHNVSSKPSMVSVQQLNLLVDIYENLKSNAQPRLQLLEYVVQ